MKDLDLIYATARELLPEERPAYLAKACEGDDGLRRRVEQLLAVADEAEAFITDLPDAESEEREPGRGTVKGRPHEIADMPDETVGQRIGRYKILEKVGEGGCGVVYVAEQTEPVRRRVALKVIKLGMDTKQVVARFEAERQALAMMDHPNIAKVLDGGATDNGRPYFIMELVRGIKITDYCDHASLSTKDRLGLFIQVCHAIQHAHQKGIIHRDIKPSNILVTLNDGVPVPKVIDFGIAKATEGRLTEATVYTQLHQFIGTPAYMSPEQAEMTSLDIDTRSDIYSLGVLLYELLTGRTPFDATELLASGIDVMRKTIREKEPLRPSTKLAALKGDELTTTAKRRASEAPKLIHLLKGDLDWIVMKCLEKDRTRRYETANGLASDIKRYLCHEPVVARPASAAYRFQKAFRRNKLAFGAAGAVAATLLFGIVISVWQAREQRILRTAAENARAGEARQRVAAQKAEEGQAKEKIVALQSLYTSLLGEARATRLARRVGYRQEVFKLLQQARALEVPQKNLADLRQQVVACLGDFMGLTPTIFSNSPGIIPWTAALDPLEKQVVFALETGGAQFCDLSTGREIAHLGGTNAGFDRFSFNATGDRLWGMRGSMDNDGLSRRIYSWKVGVEVEPVKTLAPASGGRRIYSWKRDVDGRWRDAGDFALPGAMDFVRTGTEVSAVVADMGSTKSNGAESWLAKFKLFNLSARAFLSGREVTNALPARCEFRVATTPNGELFAVHSTDAQNPTRSAQVDVYTMQTGQRIAHQDLDQYGDIKLSPDGKYLAWGSSPGSVIWTLPDLKRIGEFTGYFEDAPAVGRHMVELRIAQQPLRLRLWNPIRREDIALIDETRPRGGWTFASDDRFLLSYPDPVVYPLVTPEKLILPPHADAVTGAEFSPDGRYLTSVGKERVVRVCDSATGQILWESNDLPGPGQCVGYSPDGQWLAVGTEGSGAPCIRDARTGKRLLDLGTNGTGKTWSAQFSKDGHYLAATGEDGTQIWTIERDTNGEAAVGLKVKMVQSRPRAGQSLLFAPDSRYLALADTWQGPIGFSLYLWDLDRPEAELVARDNSWGAQCESFTPDSRSLLMMGPNREIVTLDLASRKRTASIPTRDFKGVRGSVNNFSLSPDGSMLAIATSSMRGVDIRDPKLGTLLYSLPEEDGTVYWLAWSPNSRRLAVTRDNGNIGIWNLDIIGYILTELGLNPDGDRGRETAERLALAEAMVGTGNPKAGTPDRASVGESLTAFLTALRQKVAANPADTEEAKHLATVYLWLGHNNEHQARCRKLLEQAAHSQEPTAHDRAAKAYLIQPHPDPELLKLAVASGRQALALSTSNDVNRPWFLIAAGLADVRDGKPFQAEPLLTQALKYSNGDPNQNGLGLAFRAIARVQLGRTNEARADLAALEKLALPLPPHDAVSPDLLDADRLAVCLAYEEAKALLKTQEAPRP